MWQIILMVLGCCFIFAAFIWCCRRRMRSKRAAKTREFALRKNIDNAETWWTRLVSTFKRKKGGGIHLKDDSSHTSPRSSSDKQKYLDREMRRHDLEMGRLGVPSAYASSRGSHTRQGSRLSSLHTIERDRERAKTPQINIDVHYEHPPHARPSSWLEFEYDRAAARDGDARSIPSEYSGSSNHHGGSSRRTPQPRTAVRNTDLSDILDHYHHTGGGSGRGGASSRRSISDVSSVASTALIDLGSDGSKKMSGGAPGPSSTSPKSPAQEYLSEVVTQRAEKAGSAKAQLLPTYSYWLAPTPTGNSGSTSSSTDRNPFRR